MINFRLLNDLLDSPVYSLLAIGAHWVINADRDRHSVRGGEREGE